MFERHLCFEVTANGTSLIDEMALLQGILGYLNCLVVGHTRLAVAENLGKLKELLEYGQTQLQDGQDTYIASIDGVEAKK